MAATRDVAALERRRDDECRLAPGRALGTFEDARAFLGDRGLLTRTPDSSLPSLFAACQEAPARSGGRGFAAWPATKWWWAGALEQADGVVTLKIHNGKNLLLARRTLAIVDPICRAELERFTTQPPRGEVDRLTRRLLDHLASSGPTSVDALQEELGLHARAFRALRHPLERCGAVASRQVDTPAGEGHRHSSELFRYDQLVPDPLAPGRDPFDAFEDLVAAGVAAAVIAPEREVLRWFSWRWYRRAGLVDSLVRQGRLVRVGEAPWHLAEAAAPP